MKYFTIAQKISRTYGHGDHGEELHICPIDAYHTNSKKFHPLFATYKKAEDYKMSLEYNYNMEVVELNVES